MTELRDYLHDLQIARGWKVYPPTETYSSYKISEPDERFLRSDTIVGSTTNMKLIQAYLDAEGSLSDPVAGTGAEFAFIALNASTLPEGRQVEARGKIEDALSERFEERQSGRVLGGALGYRHAYIDLLFYDSDRSVGDMIDVLRKEGLPKGTSLHFFAKGNESRRWVH